MRYLSLFETPSLDVYELDKYDSAYCRQIDSIGRFTVWGIAWQIHRYFPKPQGMSFTYAGVVYIYNQVVDHTPDFDPIIMIDTLMKFFPDAEKGILIPVLNPYRQDALKLWMFATSKTYSR